MNVTVLVLRVSSNAITVVAWQAATSVTRTTIVEMDPTKPTVNATKSQTLRAKTSSVSQFHIDVTETMTAGMVRTRPIVLLTNVRASVAQIRNVCRCRIAVMAKMTVTITQMKLSVSTIFQATAKRANLHADPTENASTPF